MTLTNGRSTEASLEAPASSEAPRALDRDSLAAQTSWLRAVARNLVRDPWGAEDVTQETLLAALAAPPPDVSTDQRLRAWLGRVAFNLSRLDARQESRRRAREVLVARRESMPSVSEEVEARAGVRELMRAVEELSELDRRVLSMRYFDDLSTAEIAARTGLSAPAVRKRTWRARARLRTALERQSRNGKRRLAGLLPALHVLRDWTLAGPSLALRVAAGLTLCAGAALWVQSSAAGPDAPRGAELAHAASPLEVLGGEQLVRVAPTPAQRSGSSGRRPLAPHAGPPVSRPPVVGVTLQGPTRVEAPVSEEPVAEVPRTQGRVLDLSGSMRAGLEIFDPEEPAKVLAISDALGVFVLSGGDVPARLEARGEGWTTVVPASPEGAGSVHLRALLVSEAWDLRGQVLSSLGAPADGASLTVLCDDAAFVRITEPVRLASPVLSRHAADGRGFFSLADLPRAPGLTLRVEREGHEPLLLPTSALGTLEVLTLEAQVALERIAGRVLRHDGRPAGGASVRLGLQSVLTNRDGTFSLPLRGVSAGSTLVAEDDRAECVVIHDFGARIRNLSGSLSGNLSGTLELVLGPEHDVVHGSLLGNTPAGWLVAAYSEAQRDTTPAGFEEADATTRSGPDGSFTFTLPTGSYSLYALAPTTLVVVHLTGLDTRSGDWRVELPAALAREAQLGSIQNAEGRALARLPVQVSALLDDAGRRSLEWQVLETDAVGTLAFVGDPEASYQLSIPAGRGTLERPLHRAGPARFVLSAPAYLQVEGAMPEVRVGTLLDAQGRVLESAGPLGAGARFSLSGGRSPVLEVPADARWLQLGDFQQDSQQDSEQDLQQDPLLLPIVPRPGGLQQIAP